jgi:hypothetical protein
MHSFLFVFSFGQSKGKADKLRFIINMLGVLRESLILVSLQIDCVTLPTGVKKAFAFYNNHARANAAANAIMLSQELGMRLKAMPPEAMLENFPDLVKEPTAFS